MSECWKRKDTAGASGNDFTKIILPAGDAGGGVQLLSFTLSMDDVMLVVCHRAGL